MRRDGWWFCSSAIQRDQGPSLGLLDQLGWVQCLSCRMCAEKCETESPTGGKSRSQSIHSQFKHELEFYFLPRSNVVPRSIPNTSCREQDITSINRITYERACEHVQMYGLTRNRRTTCRPGKITKWSIPLRHHLPFGTSTSAPRGSRASACVPRGGVIFGWQ